MDDGELQGAHHSAVKTMAQRRQGSLPGERRWWRSNLRQDGALPAVHTIHKRHLGGDYSATSGALPAQSEEDRP